MRHYLLTGATGAVGSAILKHLYQKGEQVTILLRARSEDHLALRAENLFRFCRIASSKGNAPVPIRASLAENQLGLTESHYRALTQSCTHIIHCAANVNLRQPLGEAIEKTSAITRNLLTFMGELAVVGKMEYLSTVGVAGNAPGPLREEWVEDDRSFRNAYETSKAYSEKLVREKIDQGWDITVHRPSMVIGDSRTGETIAFQVFYYLCNFLSGHPTRGLVPNLRGYYLDTVPADYVAAAVYWSSLQKLLPSRILHLCSGKERSIALNDLTAIAAQLWNKHRHQQVQSRRLPLPIFKTMLALTSLLAPPRLKSSLKTLPLFLSYLDRSQWFDNQKTLAILSAAPIPLPAPCDYIKPVLEYFLQTAEK